MITVYLVGPLFTEADQRQRRLEGKRLRRELTARHLECQLISPIDLPLNEGGASAPEAIFEADYHYQCEATHVFFDLANEDTGSHMALGILLEKKLSGKPIHLYPVYSDSRISRNQAVGLDCPIGYNAFVIGGLKANTIPVYFSFDQACDQFLKDLETPG